jgi:hypothetical protein
MPIVHSSHRHITITDRLPKVFELSAVRTERLIDNYLITEWRINLTATELKRRPVQYCAENRLSRTVNWDYRI